jgi:RNA polymerase sigma-70 factor, ECF subfamily
VPYAIVLALERPVAVDVRIYTQVSERIVARVPVKPGGSTRSAAPGPGEIFEAVPDTYGHHTATPEVPLSTAAERERRFNRFHDEHFEAVRRYAWRRDPATADDVVAETFVVAWRRLDEIPCDARGWLIGVARHVRLNLVRSQRRQQALTAQLPREAEPDLADAALPAPISEPLQEALRALSPLDREVLLLSAWDALDRSEIAVALGCSKAAVSVRLHRARRRVQRALDAVDYHHGTSVSVIAIPGGSRNGR